MVKSRRITEITLETNEIFTVRQQANSVRIHCPECGSQSAMFTPCEASALFGFEIRAICREIDAGRLHFLETESGSVLICIDSLQKAASLSSSNSTLQINPIKETL